MPVSDPAQPKASSSQVVPVLCLLGVVVLLSSITPTMKYVFQHSSLTFLSIASGRIILRPAVAAPSLTRNPRFAPRRGDIINRLLYSTLAAWMTSGRTIEVCIACR